MGDSPLSMSATALSPAKRRLLHDLKTVETAPEGITALPQEDDILSWNAIIEGFFPRQSFSALCISFLFLFH
jgi:ubiquitin-protein ligase